jgi:hypothetical protein
MAVTRTPKTPNPTVIAVAVSAGQFLNFILDAGGPLPVFSFASNVKGALYEAPDFTGHPKARYEWQHLRNPSDIQQMEQLALGLSFIANATYTYTVELHDPGAPVSTLLQVSYTGAPTDVVNESFTVVIS